MDEMHALQKDGELHDFFRPSRLGKSLLTSSSFPRKNSQRRARVWEVLHNLSPSLISLLPLLWLVSTWRDSERPAFYRCSSSSPRSETQIKDVVFLWTATVPVHADPLQGVASPEPSMGVHGGGARGTLQAFWEDRQHQMQRWCQPQPGFC